ncbi:IQ domain-containing protein [Chloropicon primus]|uniref:IQ domain-containing protein n=2 Tax=Chloropicon primus TaxID=1764295 RepID=A0A5B8MWB3_9CHLO|nr:IQ domain-containing protein [Chloropicon primus]|eukprot:QDZ24727.1 IQ domain-containing protein [Chloropicon primus]
MSMEAEYERTRDKARAYLSAIEELTLFREQVSQSTEEGKEGLENALEVAIERLNGKFHDVAGELAHRMKEIGTHGDSMNRRLKQQADLYFSSRGPSQALKAEIEGEYLESKQRKPNEEPENARMVGKGPDMMSARHKNPEPKKVLKKTREDLEEKFVNDFSKLSMSELDKGVMNMLIRGLIPRDVDLGKAFDSDFFTTMGITPAKYTDLKNSKQILQDYVESMVREEQVFGAKLHEVTMGAQKKMALERERFLKYGDANMDVKKRYTTKFLDPVKLLPTKRRSMASVGEEGDNGGKTVNEEDQFFVQHRTFRKAYQTSIATIGDGYLPLLQYKFLRTMPDFRLFKAKNSLNWRKIDGFLPRVCQFCKEKSIFLAAVPYRKLSQFAVRSQQVSDLELNEIIVNLYDLYQELQNEKSATQIQAAFKGYMVRKKHPNKAMIKSIWTIQAFIRKKALRKKFQELLHEKRLRITKEVGKLQSDLRKNWKYYSHSTKLIVHIPSLSLSQEQRITSEHFLTRQFSQLTRLCDLRNPQVSLILISPLQIPQDLLGYFLSIMRVRGVKDPKLRLKVIVPENLHRLPGHFSLAQALLASPTAYKRLEIAVQGQRAYMLPHRVGRDEQELSVSLKMPILGPTFECCEHYSTKIGARSLFQEADMNVAPGASIQPSYNTQGGGSKQREIAAKLVNLIKENPFVRKWIFKVSDEYDSRGHASLDLKKVGPLDDVAKRVENVISPQDPNSVEKIISLLEDELLNEYVVIHNTEVYPTWETYANQFRKVGGVIEAFPEWVVGSPSANVFIDPLGNVSIQSTHEQIFAQDFTFVGASFPQSSVPHLPLAQATIAIAKKCYEKGIVGYFGIDFVALRQEGFLKIWAVDLNLHMTKTQLSFQFFDLLSGGSFNAESGMYLMPYGISYSADQSKSEPHMSETSTAMSNYGSRRCYVMTDFVSSSRFEGLQLKTFFKDCRNLGLTYDIGECTGTAFNVIDTISAGVLSIFSAGFTMVDAMKEASRTLSVLARRFGQNVSRGGGKDSESFHRISSTLRFIADKLRNPEPSDGDYLQ